MDGDDYALAAFLASPWALAFLRERPFALRTAALAACALTFAIPRARFVIAVFAMLMLIKALQAAAGHEKPRGYLNFVLFLLLPVVVRWDAPPRPDPRRARRSAILGFVQFAAGIVITDAATRMVQCNAAFVVLFQVGLYLVAAGAFNVLVAPLALRGLDFDDPFDSPFLARTPGEFWGRRWNTWVTHMLHRYVFVPSAGRHHPFRGTLAAFAVSGLVHEAIFARVPGAAFGWMLAYFLVQGALVVATSRWRALRSFAARHPWIARGVTIAVILASGTLFVRGAAPISS